MLIFRHVFLYFSCPVTVIVILGACAVYFWCKMRIFESLMPFFTPFLWYVVFCYPGCWLYKKWISRKGLTQLLPVFSYSFYPAYFLFFYRFVLSIAAAKYNFKGGIWLFLYSFYAIQSFIVQGSTYIYHCITKKLWSALLTVSCLFVSCILFVVI